VEGKNRLGTQIVRLSYSTNEYYHRGRERPACLGLERPVTPFVAGVKPPKVQTTGWGRVKFSKDSGFRSANGPHSAVMGAGLRVLPRCAGGSGKGDLKYKGKGV